MIKELIKKYKKIILYLVFGGFTTLVNIVSYYILAHILNCSVMFSTIISWILAVFFAYLTNRKMVFDSKASTKKDILKEVISFFSCRILTGIIDWVGMYILVEKLHLNDMIIKIVLNIIVIILNYTFSKLIVFKDKNKNK